MGLRSASLDAMGATGEQVGQSFRINDGGVWWVDARLHLFFAERVAESSDFQAPASPGFIWSHFKFKERSQKHFGKLELNLWDIISYNFAAEMKTEQLRLQASPTTTLIPKIDAGIPRKL